MIIVIHHIKYPQGHFDWWETDRRAPGPEGERPVLNTTIMLFLIQDGITNGAIYALLGLALVLVFAVTRVILIPQGEFVTYGALTYASLAAGQMPVTDGTPWFSAAFTFTRIRLRSRVEYRQ